MAGPGEAQEDPHADRTGALAGSEQRLAKERARFAAVADVLQAMGRDAGHVQPVFDAVVRNAAEICEAAYCLLFRIDGDQSHFCASHGYSQNTLDDARLSDTAPIDPRSLVGKVAASGDGQAGSRGWRGG